MTMLTIFNGFKHVDSVKNALFAFYCLQAVCNRRCHLYIGLGGHGGTRGDSHHDPGGDFFFACLCCLSRSRLQPETHQSVMVMENDGRSHSQPEPDTLLPVGGTERLVHSFISRTPLQPPAQLSASEPAVRSQSQL